MIRAALTLILMLVGAGCVGDAAPSSSRHPHRPFGHCGGDPRPCPSSLSWSGQGRR